MYPDVNSRETFVTTSEKVAAFAGEQNERAFLMTQT
jgi:hypothetical protein